MSGDDCIGLPQSKPSIHGGCLSYVNANGHAVHASRFADTAAGTTVWGAAGGPRRDAAGGDRRISSSGSARRGVRASRARCR